MEKNNQPPFKIGDKVVLLVDGKYFPVKKGDIFTILNMKQLNCGCWAVDIGLNAKFTNQHCNDHPSNIYDSNGIHWSMSYHYAPINPYQNSLTSELAQQALDSVNDGVDVVRVK